MNYRKISEWRMEAIKKSDEKFIKNLDNLLNNKNEETPILSIIIVLFIICILLVGVSFIIGLSYSKKTIIEIPIIIEKPIPIEKIPIVINKNYITQMVNLSDAAKCLVIKNEDETYLRC